MQALAPEATTKTAAELMAYLEAMGSPDRLIQAVAQFVTGDELAKVETVAKFIDAHKDAPTPRHVFEWARASWLPPHAGTLKRIGQFVWGEDFRLVDPNVLTSTREEQLLAELKQEREARREAEARENLKTTQLRQAHDENARLRAMNDQQSRDRELANQPSRRGPGRPARPAVPAAAHAATGNDD